MSNDEQGWAWQRSWGPITMAGYSSFDQHTHRGIWIRHRRLGGLHLKWGTFRFFSERYGYDKPILRCRHVRLFYLKPEKTLDNT